METTAERRFSFGPWIVVGVVGVALVLALGRGSGLPIGLTLFGMALLVVIVVVVMCVAMEGVQTSSRSGWIDGDYPEMPGWAPDDAQTFKRWSALLAGSGDARDVLCRERPGQLGAEYLFHYETVAEVDGNELVRHYSVCQGRSDTPTVLAAGVIVQPKMVGRIGHSLGAIQARGPYDPGYFRSMREASGFESLEFDRRYEAFVSSKKSEPALRLVMSPSIIEMLTSANQPISFGFFGNTLVTWIEGCVWNQLELDQLVAAYEAIDNSIEKTAGKKSDFAA